MKIKMSPSEFMDYNCNYGGAVEWARKLKEENVKEVGGDELVEDISKMRIVDREVSAQEVVA